MSTRFLWHPSLALVLISVACQPSAGPARTFSESDAAAIRASLEEYVAVQLSGDLNRTWTFFTDDLIYMAPGGPPIEGLSTARDHFESLDFQMLGLELTPLEIQGSGDIAYARIRFTEKFTVGTDTTALEASGYAMRVFRRQQDGAWLTSVIIFNYDVPPGAS